MPAPPVVVEQDTSELERLGRVLKQHADGKKFRSLFIKDIRAALEPAKGDVRSAALRLPSTYQHRGPGLRQAIARTVAIQVKLSGKTTGVKVRLRRVKIDRDFPFAGRWLNRKGWKHPVPRRARTGEWVSGDWVTQDSGAARSWFDDAVRPYQRRAATQVAKIIQDYADMIANDVK